MSQYIQHRRRPQPFGDNARRGFAPLDFVVNEPHEFGIEADTEDDFGDVEEIGQSREECAGNDMQRAVREQNW